MLRQSKTLKWVFLSFWQHFLLSVFICVYNCLVCFYLKRSNAYFYSFECQHYLDLNKSLINFLPFQHVSSYDVDTAVFSSRAI